MLEYVTRLILAIKANDADVGQLVRALRRMSEGVSVEGDVVRPSAELSRLLERVECGEYRL